MKGKVLISGSSGLIGGALLPALKASGWQVTRLIRGASPGEGAITWDPSQPLAPGVVSGFDAIIHLAGASIVGRWTDAKKRRIISSRVPSTQNLARALAEAPQPPRVLVCASAVGFYGSRGDEVLREDSPSGQGFVTEVCREWEAASQPAIDAGIRTAHTRFGIVLSAAGGALQKMLLPFRLGAGGNMGDGRQWWPWIDMADVVGAVLHVVAHESVHGPVNVASPNPVRNADFTRTLASVLSRPAIFPMPAFMARLVFGEMADDLLLASQRVEPTKLLASGYSFHSPDLEPALRAILGK
ncbi:MAG: TIGR01777 family oxidoreductase [Acidobacteriia bacterium]|nr:TIGR01777 family oxidoreductase [Terriglobia bacterium]